MTKTHYLIMVVGVSIIATGWWLRSNTTDIREATAGGDNDDPALETLTGIDFLPSRALLDAAYDGLAQQNLEYIARTTNPTFDIGLRARAYHGLSLYPEDSFAPLLEAVEEHGSNLNASGAELVLAKAAVGALAAVTPFGSDSQQGLALAQLGDVLNHPVLDVRAAAATGLGTTGLGTTGLANAKDALTQRLQIETSPQVVEAINLSLLRLGDTLTENVLTEAMPAEDMTGTN